MINKLRSLYLSIYNTKISWDGDYYFNFSPCFAKFQLIQRFNILSEPPPILYYIATLYLTTYQDEYHEWLDATLRRWWRRYP